MVFAWLVGFFGGFFCVSLLPESLLFRLDGCGSYCGLSQ